MVKPLYNGHSLGLIRPPQAQSIILYIHTCRAPTINDILATHEFMPMQLKFVKLMMNQELHKVNWS